MIINWTIESVDQESQHAVIKYYSGPYTQRLNIKIKSDVEQSIRSGAPIQFFKERLSPDPKLDLTGIVGNTGSFEHTDNTPHTGTNMRVAGTAYTFDKGGILPEHKHQNGVGLHNIQVLKGSVKVSKDSGDVTITEGDAAVDILPDENHSVEALEPSTTLHLLKEAE